MNKLLVLLAILAIIIGGVWFLGNNVISPKSNEPIKIGVILPLTGDFAVIGEELKKGIDLAVDQLREKGANISAVYEDDQFDPKQAVSAANKLISVDKINLAMLFSIEEARPIMPIFNSNKISLISLWDSNEFLKSSGPYIYSNGFSTEKAGSDMADYAFNVLKLKNVAVLSHVDPWSEIITKSFEEQLKKNGGKIVYADQVQIGTTDFRLLISKIKSVNPDSIYIPLIPFDSVSFIKQARQAGLTVPIMSGDALIQAVIDEAGTNAEGIYFTNGYTDNAELGQLYKAKYGKDAQDLTWVAPGYDGVMKIGKALNSSESVKETLDRVFGPTRTVERVEKIYQVKNGKPVLVQ